jgi:Taurine catabolism dioxygenase TauD, TfdA family
LPIDEIGVDMIVENSNDSTANNRIYHRAGEKAYDPSAWKSCDFAQNDEWLYQLSNAEIGELKDAIAQYDYEGVDLMPLTRDEFVLPKFGDTLQKIRQELLYGRGFINFRGLPLEEIGKRGAGIVFWAISQYLGDSVCSQNDRGHLLGHVTDLGETKSNPNERGPYSRERIPFHADACDIVGLLCIQTAKAGGESSIVSSATIHNEILKRRPDLLQVLYEPYTRDRRGEIPAGMDPWYHLAVFHSYEGYFSSNIEPTYIKSASRFSQIADMSAAQCEAIELVQELAIENCFDMDFLLGDMQFLNNHVTFHSRNGFEDYEDKDQKRHLMRIWIKANDGRPLPADYYARHGAPEDIERPGGIVGPATVFSAPLIRE